MFYSVLIFAYFRLLGNPLKRFEPEEEKKNLYFINYLWFTII